MVAESRHCAPNGSNGVATSSSPFQNPFLGDEDIAAPNLFPKRALSGGKGWESPNPELVERSSAGRVSPMKGLAATGVFLVQGILLAVGVAMAANGKGVAVLIVALVVLGGMFIKMGCIDNAPKH